MDRILPIRFLSHLFLLQTAARSPSQDAGICFRAFGTEDGASVFARGRRQANVGTDWALLMVVLRLGGNAIREWFVMGDLGWSGPAHLKDSGRTSEAEGGSTRRAL